MVALNLIECGDKPHSHSQIPHSKLKATQVGRVLDYIVLYRVYI